MSRLLNGLKIARQLLWTTKAERIADDNFVVACERCGAKGKKKDMEFIDHLNALSHDPARYFLCKKCHVDTGVAARERFGIGMAIALLVFAAVVFIYGLVTGTL